MCVNSNDNIYFKYLKTLFSLDLNLELNFNVLKVFCEYISSNKNFKYNKTYLKDSINPFLETVQNLQYKNKICQAFANSLSQKYENFANWVIIIDDIFFIDENFKTHLIFDLIESDFYPELKLQVYLSKFNLYSQNKNKLVFNYVNLKSKDQIDYTKRYNIADISLFSLVEKTLIKKKEITDE